MDQEIAACTCSMKFGDNTRKGGRVRVISPEYSYVLFLCSTCHPKSRHLLVIGLMRLP